MTNKPKAIGTFAETAVKNVLLPFFPDADRGAQTGNQDQGDIRHCGQFVFEVKGGKQCREPVAPETLNKWMHEARTEALNFGAAYGVLVLQRSGYGAPRAGFWWAYVTVEQLALFTRGHYPDGQASYVPVRLELWALLEILADMGYTEDIPDADEAV